MSGRAQNRSSSPDFADIKAALLRRLDSLVRQLAPGGNVNGAYYISKNPVRRDRRAGSFWVLIDGPSKGVFKDEADPEASGDVVAFVHYCMRHTDMKQTRAWCIAYVGDSELPNMTPAERTDRDRQLEERRKIEEKAAAELLDKNRKSAFAMWLNAEKQIRDTPVDAYLRSRGMDLRELGHVPGAIRYLPDHRHTDTDTGEITLWPCMIVVMALPNGSYGAVHRTWLARDGSGKAPVTPVRKIFPSFKGCVARISKGEKNLSPEDAAKAGWKHPVVITEGIEDALAVLVSNPDARVWAAGSVANMAHVPLLPCVSGFILLADNDWDKSRAAEQFAKAEAAVRAHGLPVSVARSWIGKDANDLLLGKDD